MYISNARSSDTVQATPKSRFRGRVAGNVIALGVVSMVTDVSSEMITSILPVYLMLGLGLSPFALGLVNGLYGGVTAFVRLAGGHIADRTQRRKAVAVFGYGLSAVCKLGLLAAGSSVGWISATIGIDRVGKGVRTAPRDALISLSSDPDSVGRSFGVHRALDTAGAFTGPLLAFLILATAPGRYDAVFVVSFCIAAAGVVALVLFVQDRRVATDPKAVSLRAAIGLLRDPSFRRTCILAALFGLVTIGDAFVYLLLQRRLDIAIAYFPLLPLGTAALYMLLAAPLGVLADRVGRWWVFVAGNVLLAGVYALLWSPVDGVLLLVGVLAAYGIFYAATDGVLMAVASPGLPARLRTSGLALVQTGVATAGFIASVAFGAVWTLWGPNVALAFFLAGVCLACLIAVAYAPARARVR